MCLPFNCAGGSLRRFLHRAQIAHALLPGAIPAIQGAAARFFTPSSERSRKEAIRYPKPAGTSLNEDC
jgi:hypothetical protein